MDGGLVVKNLLLKDIEQIDLYVNEENKTIEKLAQVFNDTMEEYQSDDNSKLMFEEIDKLSNQAVELLEKRQKYTYVLNRVIEQYEYLAQRTKEDFSNGKDKEVSREVMARYGGEK